MYPALLLYSHLDELDDLLPATVVVVCDMEFSVVEGSRALGVWVEFV